MVKNETIIYSKRFKEITKLSESTIRNWILKKDKTIKMVDKEITRAIRKDIKQNYNAKRLQDKERR